MLTLTPEQILLKDMAGEYVRARHGEAGAAWTATGWRALAQELGIVGAAFPEALGGVGGTLLDAMVVMEAFGEHRLVQPYAEVLMAGRLLALSTHPAHHALIAELAAGERVIVPALQERGATDRLAAIQTAAHADGEGGYRLSGAKVMVWGAPWASHLLIPALTGPESLSLFLVERDRAGIALKPCRTVDGYDAADMILNEVRVSADDRVGPAGEALTLIERARDEGAAAFCAEAVGLMRGMIDQTTAYLRERHQFGKPLASFQVLQHRLVTMQLLMEHSASLTFGATLALEQGDRAAPQIVSAAKTYIGDALRDVGTDAIQMHGAIGLMAETPISSFFRRSMALQERCGSTEHHLRRFAGALGETLHNHAVDIVARIVGEDQEDIRFREEVRAFLNEALTPDLRAEAQGEVGAFATPRASTEWQRRLHAKGWVAPSWPRAFGGTGWTARQRQIFEAECALAGAPRLPAMGLQMCGPVLMRFGTTEQQSRFLPRILSCEDYWCQGYSETGSGSDLASLQLRAVRDGDDYILNGSKIWTTFAQFANWIFLLVRTSTEGKPQAGITFLLAPMDSPGITVRPLISMSGEHEVNQVFFDDVRVPVANRVGEENEGWRIAKYLLEFERGVGHQVPALSVELSRLREIALAEASEGGVPLWEDPIFRRTFAKLEIATLAARLTEERLIYSRAEGDSAGDSNAALMKLTWSELAQAIEQCSVEALGPYAAVDQEAFFRSFDDDQIIGPTHAAPVTRRYLNDRVMTIAGGSSEVLRNILARVTIGA
nr:acyl-CoA dehydrogenase family protein [Sphingomonas sp. CDS-1]